MLIATKRSARQWENIHTGRVQILTVYGLAVECAQSGFWLFLRFRGQLYNAKTHGLVLALTVFWSFTLQKRARCPYMLRAYGNCIFASCLWVLLTHMLLRCLTQVTQALRWSTRERHPLSDCLTPWYPLWHTPMVFVSVSRSDRLACASGLWFDRHIVQYQD